MCYNMRMQKLITFQSGLKLVLVQNPAVRSVAIGVFVGAGVVKEPKEQAGISHFIEHMVFKGTTTRSSFDIVNEIDSIGAQINAYTAKSYTCFYTISLDSNAQKCAEVLSDLYFNPTFDPDELEKERRVVIEEINESEDTPDDVCIENLFTEFFKGNALEKPILGNKRTLENMDSAALHAYHKKHYVPSNTVLSIAGNLTEKSAIELVKTYFESQFDKACEENSHASEPMPRHGYIARRKHIEQSHLAFAFPCYKYDDRRLTAVKLMTAIFCMEMSSRLFQSVREKLGLCYTVMGYPSTYESGGAYVIYTSTNPSNAEKAARAIRREIDILLTDGVSDEELKKGKEQLKTSLVLGQESSSAMMRTFGTHAIMTGKLYDFDAKIDEIDGVTKEDIDDVARYIFDFDKMCASLVSPKTDINLLDVMKNAQRTV